MVLSLNGVGASVRANATPATAASAAGATGDAAPATGDAAPAAAGDATPVAAPTAADDVVSAAQSTRDVELTSAKLGFSVSAKKVDGDRVVIIKSVDAGSDGEKNGIVVGDVIAAANGGTSFKDIVAALKSSARPVVLSLNEFGARASASATPATAESAAEGAGDAAPAAENEATPVAAPTALDDIVSAAQSARDVELTSANLGFSVSAKKVDGDRVVIVKSVDVGSDAEQNGIAVGDVIAGANGGTSYKDIVAALKSSARPVVLSLNGVCASASAAATPAIAASAAVAAGDAAPSVAGEATPVSGARAALAAPAADAESTTLPTAMDAVPVAGAPRSDMFDSPPGEGCENRIADGVRAGGASDLGASRVEDEISVDVAADDVSVPTDGSAELSAPARALAVIARALFNDLDADGGGTISTQEACALFFDPEQWEYILEEADEDEDGEVSLEEWVAYVMSEGKSEGYAVATAVFTEMHGALATTERPAADENAAIVLAQADAKRAVEANAKAEASEAAAAAAAAAAKSEVSADAEAARARAVADAAVAQAKAADADEAAAALAADAAEAAQANAGAKAKAMAMAMADAKARAKAQAKAEKLANSKAKAEAKAEVRSAANRAAKEKSVASEAAALEAEVKAFAVGVVAAAERRVSVDLVGGDRRSTAHGFPSLAHGVAHAKGEWRTPADVDTAPARDADIEVFAIALAAAAAAEAENAASPQEDATSSGESSDESESNDDEAVEVSPTRRHFRDRRFQQETALSNIARTLFNDLDVDGGGTISTAEACQRFFDPEQWQFILEEADENGDGELSVDEWVAYVLSQGREEGFADAIHVFKEMHEALAPEARSGADATSVDAQQKGAPAAEVLAVSALPGASARPDSVDVGQERAPSAELRAAPVAADSRYRRSSAVVRKFKGDRAALQEAMEIRAASKEEATPYNQPRVSALLQVATGAIAPMLERAAAVETNRAATASSLAALDELIADLSAVVDLVRDARDAHAANLRAACPVALGENGATAAEAQLAAAIADAGGSSAEWGGASFHDP